MGLHRSKLLFIPYWYDDIDYLLRDEFGDTLAAGSVNGTDAVPGPGTRTVQDTGSDLELTGGNASFTTGAWGDPRMVYPTIARAAGRFLLWHVNKADSLSWQVGFADVTNPLSTGFSASIIGASTALVAREDDVSSPTLAVTTINTDYYHAVVLRAAGAFYFFKIGSGDWTLVWLDFSSSGATLYPAYSNSTQEFVSSYIRVPDALWLPVPLVSDGFTDSNGTSLDAHATDGLGHAEGVAGGIGSGGSGFAWTEDVGDLDIQSNKASVEANTASARLSTSNSDIVLDCDVVVQYTDDVNYSRAGVSYRYTDASNQWFCRVEPTDNEFQLYEVDGSTTKRASVAIAITGATTYKIRVIAYGNVHDCYLDGGNKITHTSALHASATTHGLINHDTGNPPAPTTWDNFTIYAQDGHSQLNKF